MYSLEQKEQIIAQMKQGKDVDNLYEEYKIPKTTLYEWQEEMCIRRRIRELVNENKLEEAEKETEKLKGKSIELVRIAHLINIARKSGNLEREEELLYEILKMDSNNIRAIISLRKIAMKKGDTEEVAKEKVANRILEIDPNNVKVMSSLIRIARERGDIEREEELLNRQLKVDPNNLITLVSLTRIVRKKGDIKREEELLNRILEIDPNNVKAISSLTRISRENGDTKKEEELLNTRVKIEPDNRRIITDYIKLLRRQGYEGTNEELEAMAYIKMKSREGKTEISEQRVNDISNIQKARNIIYESEDIGIGAEEIKALLEGENETGRALILAELYYNTGMQKRAEKFLKAYKNELNKETDRRKLKVINQAIEVAKKPNSKKFEWQKIWDNNTIMLETRNSEGKDHEEDETDGLDGH